MLTRPRRSLFVLFALLSLAALLPLLPRASASAHPLGNFTINRYARLELYRDAVHIHYVVDMAEIPTYQLIGDIDSDKDGKASQAELDAYAAKERDVLAANFRLTVDGHRIDARPAETTIQLLEGQAGLNTMRLAVVYVAKVDPAAQLKSVVFSDSNENDRAGWKEILVRPSDGTQAAIDERLTVDRSDALRSYPAETLSSAPDIREVRFAWVPSSGAEPPYVITVQTAAKGRGGSGFAGVFSDLLAHDSSLSFLLLSLLVAFLFGAQHALGPGHGKTMVAAYLVGSKGTPKQAVVLGFTVTATHTSTVYLMGAVALLAASYVATETVQLWLGVVVGVMVVGFGAVLFFNRLRNRQAGSPGGEHRHGLFGQKHVHTAHGTAQEAGTTSQGANNDHHEHEHEHEHEHPHRAQDLVSAPSSGVSWRSVLSLGFLGGLLPCPSAVVVMLGAIAQGQVLLGMLLIVAFSLGLALVLTAIGIGLTLGKKLGTRQRAFFDRPLVAYLTTAMPIISAFVVMLAGVLITYQALQQPGL